MAIKKFLLCLLENTLGVYLLIYALRCGLTTDINSFADFCMAMLHSIEGATGIMAIVIANYLLLNKKD